MLEIPPNPLVYSQKGSLGMTGFILTQPFDIFSSTVQCGMGGAESLFCFGVSQLKGACETPVAILFHVETEYQSCNACQNN